MSVVGAIMVPHPPILLPEVGRGEEKKIAATAAAYERAAAFAVELKPETIVLASPHTVMYSDYFHIISALDDNFFFHHPSELKVYTPDVFSQMYYQVIRQVEE